MDQLSNKVLALPEQSMSVNLLNTTDDDFPSSYFDRLPSLPSTIRATAFTHKCHELCGKSIALRWKPITTFLTAPSLQPSCRYSTSEPTTSTMMDGLLDK